MRKLRQREVKQLVQGHRADKGWAGPHTQAAGAPEPTSVAILLSRLLWWWPPTSMNFILFSPLPQVNAGSNQGSLCLFHKDKMQTQLVERNGEVWGFTATRWQIHEGEAGRKWKLVAWYQVSAQVSEGKGRERRVSGPTAKAWIRDGHGQTHTGQALWPQLGRQ